MKDEIKRLKDCLKLATPDTLYLTAKKGLDLITEIESLDAKNQKQREKIEECYWIKKADEKLIEELHKEIKQLKQDYKDHTEVLGDKLNDQIEYLKQDREKIEELQAVREAAEEFLNAMDEYEKSCESDRIEKELYKKANQKREKLQQVLTAKEE